MKNDTGLEVEGLCTYKLDLGKIYIGSKKCAICFRNKK